MNFWKSKLNFITLYPKHMIPMGYKYKVDHNYFYLERKRNKVIEFDKIIKSQAKDTSLEGLETT